MTRAATIAHVEGETAPGARALNLLAVARGRLDAVAQLPDDWDSYGAVRPNLRAISTGHDLLTTLWRRLADAVPEDGVPWMIAPLADGGVQLEWRGPVGAIEVEIGPTGRLNFLVERDEKTLRRSDPAQGAPLDRVLDQVVEVIVGAPEA
jgi:hypothetical protein